MLFYKFTRRNAIFPLWEQKVFISVIAVFAEVTSIFIPLENIHMNCGWASRGPFVEHNRGASGHHRPILCDFSILGSLLLASPAWKKPRNTGQIFTSWTMKSSFCFISRSQCRVRGKTRVYVPRKKLFLMLATRDAELCRETDWGISCVLRWVTVAVASRAGVVVSVVNRVTDMRRTCNGGVAAELLHMHEKAVVFIHVQCHHRPSDII